MGNLEKYVLIFVAAILTVTLIISTFTILDFQQNNSEASQDKMPRASRMSLTAFDTELARQFMDRNDDGKCDACGMPVEMCIESGQMQCNMDPKSTIGVLGSAHIHADWNVYVDGRPIDFSDKAHMERMQKGLPVSSFIHVDSGSPLPEKTGDVLHMHATGVPLWVFFKSIGGSLNETCLGINGETMCSSGNKKLRFYVNGKPNTEYGDYVFTDLDKILISYGGEENPEEQTSSITDFAKNH